MIFRVGLLLLVSVCFAQQQSSQNGDRQVRLEDIERDNINSQKTTTNTQQQQQQQQHNYPAQQQVNQQQLAAYQQQLLLQQLQQQYFAPHPIAYSNFGGVPLMIIPSNSLGAGTPSPLPLQAYFLPQEPQFLTGSPQGQFYQPQQQQQVFVQPQQRYQPPQQQQQQQQQQQRPQSLQVVHQNPSRDNVHFTSSVQIQPQVYQPSFPLSNSFLYSQQPQMVYQQPQQPYNAYNAIYQQRPQKNTFAAGAKSTPAPPLKQTVQQTPNQGTSFINYKSF